MRIFKDIAEWLNFRKQLPIEKKIGLVTTMGTLHEGHFSLVKKCLKENDYTVVTIFLNPTQFNNKEDLLCYPKTWEQDLKSLETLKVDFLLTPEYSQVYMDDYRYRISENKLSKILCGASRPEHFDGVLTVVMKLFNIVKAHRAYFGEKDYQQYLIVKGMVEAFFLDIEIILCETIRDSDNLALSSRNLRLSKKGREKASIYANLIREEKPLSAIKQQLEKEDIKVDYLEECFNRRFAAVFIEGVRLIDNFLITRRKKI